MIKTFQDYTKSASETKDTGEDSELLPLPLVQVGVSRLDETGEDSEIMKGGKVLPVCYRCAQVPKEGLYDGFRVQGMFFCSDCQQELLTAEQGSAEYQEFMFLIKSAFS